MQKDASVQDLGYCRWYQMCLLILKVTIFMVNVLTRFCELLHHTIDQQKLTGIIGLQFRIGCGFWDCRMGPVKVPCGIRLIRYQPSHNLNTTGLQLQS
jgi:hypothetical protein